MTDLASPDLVSPDLAERVDSTSGHVLRGSGNINTSVHFRTRGLSRDLRNRIELPRRCSNSGDALL